MMNAIKQMIFGNPTDFKELMSRDAIIVDVRSRAEYQSGHIAKSINIPLDELNKSMGKLKKGKPIITCCASGMRSGVALRTLEQNGFTEVYNGGGWANLKHKLN